MQIDERRRKLKTLNCIQRYRNRDPFLFVKGVGLLEYFFKKREMKT